MYNTIKYFCICLLLLNTGNLWAQQILVRPYIQPGDAPTLSKEKKVLIWQTDSVPGSFIASYRLKGTINNDKISQARISNVELKLKGKATILYRAVLESLQFDTVYYYEVRVKERIVAS